MSFLIGLAGTAPAGATAAANAAAEVPVQMLTATYNTFTHWFFIYQMSTLVEILIIGFLVFIFKPFIPFVFSRIWSHLPVVGIMTRVRNIVPLGGFVLRNGMYRKEHRDNVMYFDKKYLGSYFFLGVPFDFVHMDRGFVQDLHYNKFIETLSKMGYKGFTAIENALTFNGISPNDADVESVVKGMGFDNYDIAKANINPSSLTVTSEIYVPIASSIPLDALLPYCSDWSPGSIAAQVSDTYEFRKPPVEPNLIMDLMPYIILIIAMGIAGTMLATQIK